MKKLIGGLVVVSVLFLGCEKKSEEAPANTAAQVEKVSPATPAKVEENVTAPVEANATAPVEANATTPVAN